MISLTYIASEKVIPGYGGGMSSAKAALESDTRVLAFEVRDNCYPRYQSLFHFVPTTRHHPLIALNYVTAVHTTLALLSRHTVYAQI